MKQSRTVTSAILVVAVLLTALGLTSCSKKNKPADSKTGAESKTTSEARNPRDANELEGARVKMAQTRTGGRPTLGDRNEERLRNLSPEERAKLKERRENIQQQWENMSEKQKEEFRAKMLEIRQRGENMTEEERKKIMTELREKFNAGR
ncbi:MAG: hypothetical protein ACYS6W_09280 [Planctomycetota bacterium]|jgi:hypothetical protein